MLLEDLLLVKKKYSHVGTYMPYEAYDD